MNARRLAPVVVTAAVLWFDVGSAAAQVLRPPPRSIGGLFGGRRPVDPNRTSHELTFDMSLLGGYDDNVSSDQGLNADPLAPRVAGWNVLGSSEMRYWRGRSTRSIEATGRGYVNGFPGVEGGVPTMFGGDGSVNGFTRVGSKLSLTGSGQLQYQPTFRFGSTSDVGGVPITPVDPTSGLTELSSLSTSVFGTATQAWNTRHNTSVNVSYDRRQYTSDGAFDTRSSMAGLSYMWHFNRALTLSTSYRRVHQSVQDSGRDRPLDSNTGDIGLQVQRRISPTRTLMLSAGGGVMQIETLTATGDAPFDYLAPTYHATVRVDLYRTWSLSGVLNRSTSVIEGVTRQSFLRTTGSVWLGGNIGRKLLMTATGTFLKGTPHEGETGSVESNSASLQVQYALSRSIGLIGSYSYYDHQLSNIIDVANTFPRRIDRNSVRLGMTIWLPLYGAFSGSRSGGSSGGQ
jgi:hypothetical protein